MKKVTIGIKIFIVMVMSIVFIKSFNNIKIYASTSNEFTSFEDAALYLREEMVQRKETISLTFIGSHLTTSEIVEIYNQAIAHTGVSYEGDYIKSNMINSSYTYSYNTVDEENITTVNFSFTWLSNYEMEEEVTARIDEILAELNLWDMTDYEKIKGVYDYICTYVHYDLDHDDEIESQVHNNYVHSTHSAVIANLTVCQGFSSMLYRMLLEVGVDCRYITGYSNSEKHAWNIVRIDDLYYNVDATFDRGLTVYYRYFLCTEYNFINHNRDSQYTTSEFNSSYPMSDVPYGVSATANGILNSNISWYLEANGTLTISGTGPMPSFRSIDTPWASYTSAISRIVVSEGITTIGGHAFIRCNYATSVSLPSTLKTIGTYAFDNCRSLREIILPDGLMVIETNAFSECSSLTRIELPDTVVSCGSSVFSTCGNLTYVKLSAGMDKIPDSMFFNMDSLQTVIIPDGITEICDTAFCGSDGITSITIPKQITKIGVAAFSDCTKLQNIYVDSANQNFVSVNGILFTKDMKTLVAYPAGKTATSYTIPDGVTTIAYGGMGGIRSLVRVYFPTSLTRIEGSAFSDCIRLSTLTFPENLEYIGQQAFHTCKNLKSISFLNPNTTFDWHVFANCKSLVDVTLPANLNKLEVGLFSGCSSLNEITIPASVTSIDSSALSWCTALRTIYIKGPVSYVHSQAFSETKAKCIYIDSDTLANRITSSSALGNLFSNCQTIVIKSIITSVPSYVKNNYSHTSSIVYEGNTYTVYSKHSCVFDTSYADVDMCNACGLKRDKHVHKYDVNIVYPTCTTSGYNYYFCDCGYSFKNSFKDPLGHSYDLWYYVSETTCLEDGELRRDCIRCSVYETSFEYAYGHNIVIDQEVLPTCTDSGLSEGSHCTRCNYKVAQEVVPALGHNIVIDQELLPTCTDTGLTEGSHCTRCSYKEEQNIVPALGHTYGNWIIVKDATEFEEGLKERSCNRCLIKESIIIPTLDHVHHYQSFVTMPTCLENGYTTYRCSCGESYVDSYVDALGHNLVNDAEVLPTCTDTGLSEGRHCTRCNYEVKQNIVPALGHNIVIDLEVLPTCTDTGLSEGSHCTRCSYKVAQEVIPAKGHDIKYIDKVDATCVESGLTEGEYCTRCDYKVAQTIVPALGHKFDEWAYKNEPTCDKPGEMIRVCLMCGILEEKDVDKLTHQFSEWEVIEASSCHNDGLESHYCLLCGFYEENVIISIGHEESEWIIDVPATETTKGQKHKECIHCGEVLSNVSIPATGSGCRLTAVVTQMLVLLLSVSLFVFVKRKQ